MDVLALVIFIVCKDNQNHLSLLQQWSYKDIHNYVHVKLDYFFYSECALIHHLDKSVFIYNKTWQYGYAPATLVRWIKIAFIVFRLIFMY